ncbi:MAG: type I restriction enzyme M protein [Colwellia sp.]|jgi:type I restriction enzyme M protein
MKNSNLMGQKTSEIVSSIWSIADLLRRDFKISKYGRIILPLTLLFRLDNVLATTKGNVLTAAEKSTKANEESIERSLIKASGYEYYNTSKIDLSEYEQLNIKENIYSYVRSFSINVQEIFEYFDFERILAELEEANLLYKILTTFGSFDLSTSALSPHEMGDVFEELTRRFAESSSETAGEHFTPRDVVELTTALVFMGDDELLSQDAVSRKVYDPTAGTGGFLSAAGEYVNHLNSRAVLQSYGQELNPESYAICKSHMLIRGQDFNNIKLGNTLSNDKFSEEKFDYMFSNAPFGLSWVKERASIERENKEQGIEARFCVGLPRIHDGSLLFLMHLVSKFKDKESGGSRIALILNGSPLFTGDAGSGESEIRRYIFENDLLEGVIALPSDLFYNTGVSTYIWILSNNKVENRKGVVKLINASSEFAKMRNPLGSKRNLLSNQNIKKIIEGYFGNKELNEKEETSQTSEITELFSKNYKNNEFSYRRIIVERPLKLSVHMSDERLESLRFKSTYSEPMKWIFETYGANWCSDSYGELEAIKDEVLNKLKTEFPEAKSSQLHKSIDSGIWKNQKVLLDKAYIIQKLFGKRGGGEVSPTHDYNKFVEYLDVTLSKNGIELDRIEKKELLNAITWKNTDASTVIKRVIEQKENHINGAFLHKKVVVEFEPDHDLREVEKVPFNTSDSVLTYYNQEVKPYCDEAWINCKQVDEQDSLVGKVGYEITLDKFLPTNEEQEIGIELRRLGVDVVSQDETWDILIHRVSAKAFVNKESEEITITRHNSHLFTFLQTPDEINRDYLAYELNKKLETLLFPGNGAQRHIPLDKINRLKLNLPELSIQEDFVENRMFLTRIISDTKDLLKRYDLESGSHNRIKLERFKNSIDETQFIINKAPYFLSELLYRSTNLEGKDRFEVLLKFLECVSIYYCSILYPMHKGDKQPNTLSSIRTEYATFSRWNKLLEELTITNNTISSIAKQLLPLLKKANTIRNTSVGHGAIPTKKQITEDLQSIESIVSSVNEILLEAFDNYELIYPLKSSWDGAFFTYEVITYSGLCGYPFSNNEIKVRKAFLDGGLYLISKNRESVYPIHNFMMPSDISKDSQIDGFYFYSKYDKNSGHNEYICHQQVPIQTKLINEQF